MKIIFIILISFLSAQVNAQKKLHFKKKKIYNICKTYLDEAEKFYTTDYDFNNLNDLCTQPIKSYYKKNAELQLTYGYKAKKEPLAYNLNVQKNNTDYTCVYTIKGKDSVLLNLSKIENHWLISGFNNKITTQSKIDSINKRIDFLIKNRKDNILFKTIIDSLTTAYHKHFNSNDTHLKNMCTPLGYEQLVLNKKLKEFDLSTLIKLTISDFTKTLKLSEVTLLNDSSVKCEVFNNDTYSSSKLYFNKINGQWKFSGENVIPTTKSIELKKEKINQLKKVNYYSELLNKSFRPIIETFFRKENDDLLKQTTSEDVFNLLIVLREKFGDYNTSFIHIEEFKQEQSLFFNNRYYIDKDSSFHFSRLVFDIKPDSSISLTGFYGKESMISNEVFIADNYNSILKQLQLDYRDIEIEVYEAVEEYVTVKEYETAEEYETVGEYYEIIQSIKDDINIYNITDIWVHPPEFNGKGESLYNFIETHKKIKSKRNKYIFVEFVIEKDGSINSIKVLNKINKKLTQDALNIIKQMPNWTPAKNPNHDLPLSYKYVLPIKY